jgi:DNA-binding phage protein
MWWGPVELKLDGAFSTPVHRVIHRQWTTHWYSIHAPTTALNGGASRRSGIKMTPMVRVPLTDEERERGERLGQALRATRAGRSMVDVATEAGISVETLRKIETGRIPTPAFFTVAAIADAVGLPLEELRAAVAPAASSPLSQAS